MTIPLFFRNFIDSGTRRGKTAFFLYVCIVIAAGSVLTFSGIMRRAELQTIDRRFELRSWFRWNAESSRRLAFANLVDYHREHEIPLRWWAWDYTLSWLIEPNQTRALSKIVIFNHLLEDEPPVEAIKENPWLAPLAKYPISRASLASIVEFLARSGARLIILDNDFPQYSEHDAILAKTIHNCSSGKFGGRKVPILIAGTVVHRTAGNAIQVNFAPPAPGVLGELGKLEPGEDLTAKYVGNVNMVMDEDQIVRRCLCTRLGLDGPDVPSIAMKSLTALGQALPQSLPAVMDIDFIGPPNSDQFPVRPFTYLFDPALKARIAGSATNDVCVKDSIVILGDGVTDVFATPYTNAGVNLRSGSEIIAQSVDTIARRSWPQRLDDMASLFYLAASGVVGASLWCFRRLIWTGRQSSLRAHALMIGVDLAFYCATIALSFGAACMLFSYAGLIAPLVVPIIALTIAALATALWEREAETAYLLKEQLRQMEENFRLEQVNHQVELRASAAEARTRQIAQAEGMRKDFVRKINHDLKAPVTVMSWTLAKWNKEGLHCNSANEKLERMVRTCDRLVGLLHELGNNYDRAEEIAADEHQSCELSTLIRDCISMAQPLAESKGGKIELIVPSRRFWVSANQLELSRVFDNLIRNALVHNPDGTRVCVEIRSQAHRHQVSISDQGTGIESDRLDSLFERSRNEEGRERLGLAIVRGFVEKSGGTITVASERSCGTTFTVTLPSLDLVAGGDTFDTGCEDPQTVSSATQAEPFSENGGEAVRLKQRLSA
ncbi:MAG: CHASE2 domain-containing protein [Candidatus Obscuribacterales bacterium]|nr:CHASE2 domain-containing protein [Candidatus Obscuribacterales bacterium]